MADQVPALAVCTVATSADAPVARLLDALRDQVVTPGDLEVIVVDATPDATFARAADGRAETVHVLRGDPFAAAGRLLDAAWQSSTAPGVGFLSVDALPATTWAEVMLRTLARGRHVVGGSWLPITDGGGPFGPASFRLWSTGHEVPLVSADTMACLRADLERVGGFGDEQDADVRDTRLAARLVDAGADPVWVPAFASHEVDGELTIGTMLRERSRVGPMLEVLSDHPRARARLLVGGLLWNRRHAFTLLALLGLVLGRKDRRFVLLGAPWVHERTCKAPRAGGPRRRWFVLPGVLALDSYDAITTTFARLRRPTR